METKMPKNQRNVKKENVKRKASIFTVMLWLFLIITMVTILLNSIKTKNAIENTDDNLNIELVMYDKSGSTPDSKITEFSWNPLGSYESKQLVMQINYNGIAQKEYQPGELVIQINSFGKSSFCMKKLYLSWFYNSVTIQADKITTTTKNYNFSYSYDEENNIITFVNNNVISKDENLEGTIELKYILRSNFNKRTELQFKAKIKENMSSSSDVIKESNLCKFHYTAQNSTYYLETIATMSAKSDYTNIADIVDNYYWVKYEFNIQTLKVQALDAYCENDEYISTGNCIKEYLDDGCVLYDKNFNKLEPKEDNAYYYLASRNIGYYFVGYPKSKYNIGDEVTNKAEFWGRFTDTEELHMLAEDFKTVTLDIFDIANNGRLNNIVKFNDNYNNPIYLSKIKNGTANFKWKITPQAIYTGNKMDIEITDDELYITRENGEITKLNEEEYSFTSIGIPQFDLSDGENLRGYTCDIYIKVSGSDDYNKKFGSVVINNSLNIYNLPSKVVGVKIILRDVDKNLELKNNIGGIELKVNIKTSDCIAGDNVLKNYANIKVHKKDTAGNVISTDEESTYTTSDIEKGEFELSSKIFKNTENNNFNGEKYEVEYALENSFNISYFDVSKDCIIDQYYIAPNGVKVVNSKEEIINSITSNMPYKYLKLKDGSLFNTQEELNEYIKQNTVVNINSDYKNSGRVKVDVKYNLKDIDWSYYLSKEIYGNFIRCNIKTEISYDNILKYGRNYKNYLYTMWNYDIYGNEIDNGKYDEIASDINNNGNTSDLLVSSVNELDLSNTVLYKQSVKKQVKTDFTKEEFVEGNVKASFGSQYTYKLKVTAGENSIKDLIIYSTLENTDDKWQGEFLGIDVTEAESKGYLPVVYYSEENTPGKLTEEGNTWKVLNDSVDKSTVKAICVDLRNKTDGTEMELPSNNAVFILVNMKAPEVDTIVTATDSSFSADFKVNEIEEVVNSNQISINLSKENIKKSISGKIAWVDENNKYNLRPENITVKLLQNGVEYVSTTTNKSKNWEYEFESVPVYLSTGEEFVYEVVVEEIIGYKTKYEGYNIISELELKEIIATKIWEDNENIAKKRPTSIILQVKNGEDVVVEQEVNGSNEWKYTFNLPKYNAVKEEINYTVDEKLVSKFYEKELTDNFTITNKFVVPDEKINVEVTSIWEDNNNEAGKRPESVILQIFDSDKLITETEVNEKSEWKYTFTNLPKYRENGDEIEYTVKEKSFVNDKFYITEIVGNTITNRFTVPEDKISIVGVKNWNDSENAANKRPTAITLQVKANGTVIAEQVVNEKTNWRYEFEARKYDELGNEIIYTVDEKDTGSKFYVKEKIEKTSDTETIVTNKFEVPDERISLEVTSIWDDNDDEAGKRPESVTLQVFDSDKLITEAEVNSDSNWKHTFTNLQKYGEDGEEIEYIIKEKSFANDKFYVTEIVGNMVTNRFTVPDTKITITGIKSWNDNENAASKRPTSITLQLKSNGIVTAEQVVTEASNWRYEFETQKYDRLGNEVVYTIDEKNTGSKFYIKENVEKISDTETVVTNKFVVPNEKVNIEVVKVWNDRENESLKRPDSVTLQVKTQEKIVASHESKSSDYWRYTFENLPKYDSLGNEIVYTVDEEYTNKFYIKEIVGNTITNTFVIPDDKVKIVATKVWDDLNDFARKRDESVILQLKSKGKVVTEHIVSEENNWSYEFEAPKYDNLGNEIEYYIDEKDTENKFYKKELTNATTITNKFEVPNEKIKLEVTSVWDDNENVALKRPDSITLQVKNNGIVVAEQVVTNDNNFKYTFELPKYNETGNEILYTIDEKELDESISQFYIKQIVGNVITNKFVVPEDRIKIPGKKVWEDDGNKAGKRDLSVILQLKVGDAIISEAEVNEECDWSYEFEAPKYDSLGNELEYYIDERDTDNKFYKKELDKNTVTNRFVVPEEVVLIKAVKKWEDNNDEYNKRPKSVTLQVYNGENLVAEEIVNADNNWSYEFKLPKYDEYGDEIKYTVDEKEDVKDYEKTIEGNVVINKCTYTPPVNTSDINIFVYIGIFCVSIIGVIVGINIVRKNNNKSNTKK